MRATRVLMITASLAALSGSVMSGTALAQDAEEPRVIYKDRTEIDFEGVEVAGELVKPQGALLLDRKRASFNPLIKLRVDFNSEMSQSVDEVK